MSSHPASRINQPKENTLNVAVSKDVIETDEIKKKNDVLEKELQQIRLKLEQSENELSKRKFTDNFMKEKEEELKKPTIEQKPTIKAK